MLNMLKKVTCLLPKEVLYIASKIGAKLSGNLSQQTATHYDMTTISLNAVIKYKTNDCTLSYNHCATN